MTDSKALKREPRTPNDIVDRLGVQQGSRVHASLVGDRRTLQAAEYWLELIALDHWHEIIADLRSLHAAPSPESQELRGEFEAWADINDRESLYDAWHARDAEIAALKLDAERYRFL